MQRGKGCGYKGEELGSFVVMADLNYLDHDDGYTKPHVIKLHRATHTHRVHVKMGEIRRGCIV